MLSPSLSLTSASKSSIDVSACTTALREAIGPTPLSRSSFAAARRTEGGPFWQRSRTVARAAPANVRNCRAISRLIASAIAGEPSRTAATPAASFSSAAYDVPAMYGAAS